MCGCRNEEGGNPVNKAINFINFKLKYFSLQICGCSEHDCVSGNKAGIFNKVLGHFSAIFVATKVGIFTEILRHIPAMLWQQNG